VIYGRSGQVNEEEMFKNAATRDFHRFLSLLGEKIEVLLSSSPYCVISTLSFLDRPVRGMDWNVQRG